MFRLTFELPRRRWCDATGAVLLSLVTAVRSLVDFRQLKDITLSEHVRSNVECDVCKAYIKMNIHTYLAYITISPLKKSTTSDGTYGGDGASAERTPGKMDI